ncbi:MAG: efflux RND transporter periplasmic adaptor subunit [Puniceicoccales bacterium]|nr:efflux RND transporter periplasmic adaptor subunit [Puniceicoccales bacterium]
MKIKTKMPARASAISASLTLIIILALALGARQALASEQLYTCGMHPQIIKKEPGLCPVCNMKLTPMTPTPNPKTQGAGKLHIDAATAQRMNLKTVTIGYGPVRREWRTTGIVAYNEEGLHDITTKYEGWIEKLHVNTTWAKVKAGDLLFEIYSPELQNAQLNYIAATKPGAPPNDPLAKAALARLHLYDVSEADIAHIHETRKAPRTLLYRAPVGGVVVEKMVVTGQMIKPGERIYRIADLGTVWVNAQIYEKDMPFVREGQAVVVRASYAPDAPLLCGVVQIVLPQVDEQTRSATVRITLPNANGTLRPGMFVTVDLGTQLAAKAVLVPDSAVLRSGGRDTVFVALDDGLFSPREVKLGARSTGQFYQVISGLDAGERIVTSGQFLLDSESRLREAVEKMLPSNAPPSAPQTPVQTAEPTKPDASSDNTLAELATAAADVAGALALDDFAAYQQQLPALKNALQKWLDANKDAVQSPIGKFALTQVADIASARRDYEPFSTTLAKLIQEKRTNLPVPLHIFECEMAPGGTARWIQHAPGARNPFYGSTMLRCGTEIDPPKPAN